MQDSPVVPTWVLTILSDLIRQGINSVFFIETGQVGYTVDGHKVTDSMPAVNPEWVASFLKPENEAMHSLRSGHDILLSLSESETVPGQSGMHCMILPSMF